MGPGKFLHQNHSNPDDWRYVRLYYAYGMISRWVRPGARRILTPHRINGIYSVGFKNPDGTIVTTFFTDADHKQFDKGGTYRVLWHGKEAVITIPDTRSAITLIWNGIAAPSDTLKLDAESADQYHNVNLVDGVADQCTSGSWIPFSNVNLTKGFDSFIARYSRKEGTSASFSVVLDSIDGEVLGKLDAFHTKGWNLFAENGIRIPPTSGIRDVYIRFSGEQPVGRFDWFRFDKEQNTAARTEWMPPTTSIPQSEKRKNGTPLILEPNGRTVPHKTKDVNRAIVPTIRQGHDGAEVLIDVEPDR